MKDKSHLKTTLKAPEMPSVIPKTSHWLAGEGAGSWFNIVKLREDYEVTRYSPEGVIECVGMFKITNQFHLDLSKTYTFVFLSHCKRVTINQGNNLVVLERID